MKKILLILLIAIKSNIYSQIKFEWELMNKDQKIHINTTDINLWLLSNNDYEFKNNNITIIPDENQNSYNITVLGFTKGKGLSIKLDIGDNPKLIGRGRKMSLVNKDSGENLGYFEIPVGSGAPQINILNSGGLLPISQSEHAIRIGGYQMNGITNVRSVDGLVLIKGLAEGRDDKNIYVKMQANSAAPQSEAKFTFSYLAYDNNSKDLETKITVAYTIPIKIYQSSSIDLKTEKNVVYIRDIIDNGGLLKRKIKTFNGNSIGNDGTSINIVSDGIIGNTSNVLFGSNNAVEGDLELFFTSAKDLKPGEIYVKMKAANNQEYSTAIKLLSDPVIITKQNKDGNLKFISNELNQILYVEGDNIADVTLTPVITGNFNITYRGGDDKIGQYVITVTNENIEPGKYHLELIRNKYKIETFAIDIVYPRKPQNLSSLFLFKQNGKDISAAQYPIELSIDDGDIIMYIDNSKVDDKKGDQSINIKIKYYDEYGNLLDERLGRTSLGENNIVLKKSGLPTSVPIYATSEKDDIVKPWGEVRIEVGHSSDFYQQDLEKKQLFIQRLIFTKKNKTSLRVALTIPPALMIYGWRDNPSDGSKLEFLPINVGFGAKLYFRKEKNNYFDKSKFSLGAYFAGINFAGKAVGNSSDPSTETANKKLINAGDLAFMLLGQIELRRDDNLIKLPIIFGPGFTLPVGGEKNTRAFFALGIGINL